ncbi:hypothetical protein HUJ04_009918 [Dendroctonus ponderosae]|uniref:Membrane-bound transcription factor site-2 protease n=1 Tax=Dendroctonus ponderosae TaxID=77166 RepID=A0AAR5Q754_DENPD|nr:hypothetical protein HUJ04_009918 [Dendroctonus ponderosae]
MFISTSMDILYILLLIAGGYCILLFFDFFFKSCAHYPYLHLLDGLGLKISYFSINWKTKALNRLIIKWGNTKPLFWRTWFDIGIISSLLFFPITLYLLVVNILDLFLSSSTTAQPLITPIIPGVNLPVSEVGYYGITLLICTVVHEFGHAFAATLEDVGVLEFGCNIYFIIPVAYVSLNSENLPAIKLRQQLRIFTAGIWHNIVLACVVYLLYCSLPSIFSTFFEYGNGVSVSKIMPHSPLRDPSKGLSEGDVITAINNCGIRDENDWYNCLSNTIILIPAVCIQSDFVHTRDESVPLKHLGAGFVECCDPKNTKNLCFEFIDTENNELALPGHVCLPGRITMEHSIVFCTESPHSCSSDMYCFKPILPNNTYLLKMISKTKNVIYIGHPTDLFQTIEISSYISKTNIFSIQLPNIVTKLVKYIVIISLGLAFLNIQPVKSMDGQYILSALGLLIFKNKFSNRQIIQTSNVITWITTILLTTYLIYSFILML